MDCALKEWARRRRGVGGEMKDEGKEAPCHESLIITPGR